MDERLFLSHALVKPTLANPPLISGEIGTDNGGRINKPKSLVLNGLSFRIER